jgi:SAM-dependent methyltransferase
MATEELAGRTEYGRWQQRRLRETVGRPVEAAEPAVLARLQARVDDLLGGVERPVRILDAGCGKQMQIPIAAERHVVGIDISPEQVGKNPEVDEGLVGDVQTYPFEAEAFDVVVCWNVLEHVEDPRAALANFERALRSPGLLILAGPHPHSFKGAVTKFTPFWVHRLAWKRWLGGPPNLDRFPTHMSDAALPEQLTSILGDSGMRVELLSMYESWEQRSFRYRSDMTGRAFRAAVGAVELASLRTVTGEVTDFVLVASK